MAKIKYGLSHVYVAKRSVATDGTVSYATPINLPGAVSFSIDKESNATSFYADNVAYFTTTAKVGESGDLELADLPRSVLKDYLGYKDAANGGVLETNDLAVGQFALMFQVETDEGQRKFVYYNCTMAESSEEYSTIEDDVSVQTSTVTITATGETVGAYQVFKQVVEKGDANYDTVFTSVTVPTFAE